MASPLRSTIVSSLTKPRSWIDRLWVAVAERGRAYISVPSTTLAPLERARRLATALLSERGEASGAAVARELQAVMRGLDADERLGFYRFLAAGFLPDERRLRAAAEAYLAQPSAERAALLAEAAEPARQELLRRMNMSMGGTAALVAMRKELLGRVRQEPALKPLDGDLRHLFASWFNRGFLELRRIDWETPAAILEKLIEYEAVHQVQGWDDLRRRLGPDRRCFAFFHPSLPGEPLIFVEVALVEGLATAVQPLLMRDRDEKAQRERAARADTAIFYSISNCQEGLRGVSFGNFLIKQVVEELKAELPHLTRFSTLSPVPTFRRWLEQRGRSAQCRRERGAQPRRRRGGQRGCRRRAAVAAQARAMVGGSRGGRGAAPAAGAALRAPPRQPGGHRQRHRSGGAVPSRQRRAARAHQLARQPRTARRQGILRPHGQLSLRSRRYRGQP
jgi:malonyl-CoA decarboxylase